MKSTLHDVNYGGVVLSHGRILTIGTKSAIHYTDKKSIKVHLNGFSEGFDVVEVFPTEPLGMLLVSSSGYQKYYQTKINSDANYFFTNFLSYFNC